MKTRLAGDEYTRFILLNAMLCYDRGGFPWRPFRKKINLLELIRNSNSRIL
jgi:hypothetical protein